jgi:alpha-tubulin suppressor-like RCC1 family protein
MRHAALIGALCTVCVTACSDDTGPNISGVPSLDIIRVDVAPSIDTMFVADTLRPGDRLQMKAAVIGRLGTPIPSAAVVWASSKPQVATITEDGLVVPTGYGTTIITASASSVGKATITVMPAAQSVIITPASDTIFVEDPIAARDSIRLTAKALDEKGAVITGVAFAWASAGAATATVSAAGTVLARSLGVVNISATSGTHVGTASIRVASVVKTVQVSTPVTTVLAKDTVQLAATALGYDDKPLGGRTFTWTSSNPTIATVDDKGRAVFLTAGSATFTAKSAFTTSAVTVNALPRQFQSIDVGEDFSCGYTNLGRGYCWGLGSVGQLASAADSTCFGDGTGKLPCAISPKRFAGNTLEFTAIQAGGVFGCGITKDKQIYCWGDDAFGEIGNGSKGGGAQPNLATVGQVRFDSITVGRTHACALSTTKQVYCWGNDAGGELGDFVSVSSTTPIPIASTAAFTSIAAGDHHTCGISGGTAYCWGDNSSGQLGSGSVGGGTEVPVAVTGTANLVAISAGGDHTCALTATGSALCWGADYAGESGPLSEGDVAAAAEAVGGGSFTRISAGSLHTCAINTAGAAFCWGSNAWGQTAGTAGSAMQSVSGAIVFKSISAGERHSCGVGADGETYCWGSNMYGALGNELQAAIRTSPQKVALPR